jgi:hypothetical protein
MTEEEFAAQVARTQAETAAALGTVGPAALDGWRMILETLEGMVAMTVQTGYPAYQARAMVAAQFVVNCKALS